MYLKSILVIYQIEKIGWVKSTKDKTTSLFEIRKLFEVIKLSLVN